MAVGFLMSGNGLGMLIFIPLTQFLVEWKGWRGAFLIIAAMEVLWLGPLNALLQSTKPDDKGFAPDGDDPFFARSTETQENDSSDRHHDYTLSILLRNRSFWMMCLAYYLNPLATFTIILHQVAILVDRGFEPLYVASMLGLVGVFSIVGKLLGGILSDKIGREWAYSIFIGFSIFAVISLCLLNREHSWIFIIYIVLGGLGMEIGQALFPAMAADLFPSSTLGRIHGILSVFSGFGSCTGAWLAGYVYDITGGYNLSLLSLIFVLLSAMLFVWIAAPRKAKRYNVLKN
jgi:predicted MFS family arabinose efflux permease